MCSSMPVKLLYERLLYAATGTSLCLQARVVRRGQYTCAAGLALWSMYQKADLLIKQTPQGSHLLHVPVFAGQFILQGEDHIVLLIGSPEF